MVWYTVIISLGNDLIPIQYQFITWDEMRNIKFHSYQ